MDETDELIKLARPILIEAVNLDFANQPNDALDKYMHGINKLDEAIKSLKRGDSRREALRKQISQYITRAESLKSKTKIEVRFIEQRKIMADSTGHGYDKVFGKCIDEKLTAVHVQDAYIIAHHQILNFVRFCELLVTQAKNIRLISLLTGTAAEANKMAFTELRQSLESKNITLKIEYNLSLHDREIRFNNGWVIKIGRGLDYFKNPGKYSLGACDMNLKPCYETTVDIFKCNT